VPNNNTSDAHWILVQPTPYRNDQTTTTNKKKADHHLLIHRSHSPSSNPNSQIG